MAAERATSSDREPAAVPDKQALRAAGLRFVNDSQPGIRRHRAGQGFRYTHAGKRRVADSEVLQRIRALAIPPAYVRVWICESPTGHLQATGYDNRGRKQYRYHPQWRVMRDDAKFERMVEFGAALPRLRRRIRQDLARPGLPHDKVLALIVALLDSTCSRIGNRQYARDNGSYGLTTLRRRHVRSAPGYGLLLCFPGKGGQDHQLPVTDARLARLVRRCKQLPGQQLFQYLGEDGERRSIDSGEVNDYLREVMGAGFSAKDFRTWNATLRAIALLSTTALPEPTTERALNACSMEVIRQVAAELRNTPAVCRKSYINPVVFEAWRAGKLSTAIRYESGKPSGRAERWGLALLRKNGAAAAKAARDKRPGR